MVRSLPPNPRVEYLGDLLSRESSFSFPSSRVVRNTFEQNTNLGYDLCIVHTSDGDGSGDGRGSTKSHINPVKWRRSRGKQTLLFSSVPSPFYRVCMEFRASVSVSVASVNQALVLILVTGP